MNNKNVLFRFCSLLEAIEIFEIEDIILVSFYSSNSKENDDKHRPVLKTVKPKY